MKGQVERDMMILSTSQVSLASGADCLMVMVRHSQYRGIELSRLMGLMRTPVLIDGRNVFDKGEARRAGFVHKGVGNIGSDTRKAQWH